MSHARDATVGDDRYVVLMGVLGYSVNRCGLRASDGHHFLRDADRSTAHAHAQCVGTCVDQALRLRLRDHVASDNLQMRIIALDVFDHFDLVDGIALRRIEDDHVDSGLHEALEPLLVFLSRSNRRAA